MKNEDIGKFGGCIIRGFKGDGVSFIAGAVLSPEDVASWPLGNKLALQANGCIDWYGPPVEAETKARAAGANTPSKAKEVKPPVVKKASTRTK